MTTQSKIGDYDQIMSDKKIFNAAVYTPLSEAIKILEERQQDENLGAKIEELLGGDIPEPLRVKDKYGISGKQVATPNLDTRWFINLTKEFGLKTLFFEYYNDKFISKNSFKHSLGQLIINNALDKRGEQKVEKVTIVNFNKYDGKPLRDVLTLWSEPLIDFHKRIFDAYGFNKADFIFYDESIWLKRNGDQAKNYYERDLLLYVCHGILFENFLITGEDGKFVKEVFLPAFYKVLSSTGLKPLIVPIPPMDIEEDQMWLSHEAKIKPYIK